MTELDFRAPAGSEELGELAPIVAWAFNETVDGSRRWLERSRLEDLRLARAGSRVVGGLTQIPMGQWFGGSSVPMLGLAGVAVAPSARGSGVALGMIAAVLREARERGFALSTLYPSTVAFYRKTQYELAGTLCQTKLRLAACPSSRGRECELRDATPDDREEIERLYTQVARERPGYLARHAYNWARVREYNGRETHGVVVHAGGKLEGYAFAGQRSVSDGVRHDLRLTDFVGTTARATERILDFLGAHRSTADHALWFGGTADDRLLALPDKGYQVAVDAYFMVRIVDVAAALAARGYPELEREVVLEVSDPLLPENTGAYRLAVSGGRAEVSRLSRGSGVRLDVRALAPLYTGFASVNELERAGAISGDARSLSTLGLFFTGTAPALCDFF